MDFAVVGSNDKWRIRFGDDEIQLAFLKSQLSTFFNSELCAGASDHDGSIEKLGSFKSFRIDFLLYDKLNIAIGAMRISHWSLGLFARRCLVQTTLIRFLRTRDVADGLATVNFVCVVSK